MDCEHGLRCGMRGRVGVCLLLTGWGFVATNPQEIFYKFQDFNIYDRKIKICI